MFSFLNNLLSVIVWLLVAYLLNFSILGWIIGLIASFIFKEFIGPLIIIRAGDKYLQQPELFTITKPPTSTKPPISNKNKVINFVCSNCQCEIKVSEYEMKTKRFHCSECKALIDFSNKNL